jgi:glucose-6-phosphate 1-dehydrogenase
MSETPSTLTPDPTIFILYGATGDLAHRLVLPAFFQLAIAGLLPSDWRLIGNGRGDVSHEDFQERMKKSLEEFGPKPSEGPWDEVAARLRFAGGGFDATNPGCLLDVLKEAQAELGGSPQIIHYMAVPPAAFGPLTEAIGAHDLAKGSRVVYEKPFGTSQESFTELDRIAHETFEETQIYRIDHFLGKEATQDIHVLRFANGLFAGAWDRTHIESVQIDVPETLDVAMRASFYESTGAILDMLVTHLMQLAAEVAMDPPHCLEPECLAKERESVIGTFRPLTHADVVVGQYEGYRETEGVAKDSRTETFVAARMWVDNERWDGVPFLLRTGKCLAESHQRVSVNFRDPVPGLPGQPIGQSVLAFELSGDGEVRLTLVVKEAGVTEDLDAATFIVPLGKTFHTQSLPAYSRLLHDVLMGDRSLFTRPDGLAHVWKVAGELLHDKPEPVTYPKDSWGPPEAAALIAPEHWILGQ